MGSLSDEQHSQAQLETKQQSSPGWNLHQLLALPGSMFCSPGCIENKVLLRARLSSECLDRHECAPERMWSPKRPIGTNGPRNCVPHPGTEAER
jgi:hypothetical protein